MNINRRLRWVAAITALVSVLFAQLAVAAYSCPGMMQAPPAAVADSPEGDMGCGDPAGAGRSALCHAHCQQGDQSFDKSPVPEVGPLAGWIGRVVFAEDDRGAAPASPGQQPSLLARATAPPIAVRHCCFRI